MIVGGLKSSTSRRRYHKDSREVKLIHTKPSQPMRWSEHPITFSRADHWVHILDPGSYPLVVEPIVVGALLAQTLIDSGSGLNVIFVDTMKKMDFDFKRLMECDDVTTPPEIIPYYCLNHSIWSLSDNKESSR
jgi:hypothetical protein